MAEKVLKIKKSVSSLSVKERPLISKERYFEAVGRRKTAVARVRIFQKKDGRATVNNRDCDVYFKVLSQRLKAVEPLEALKLKSNFFVSVKVKGGGLDAQASAMRHGLARALTVLNPIYRKKLRELGYLTRDSRMVERKKYGLKKARRAPQWQKR